LVPVVPSGCVTVPTSTLPQGEKIGLAQLTVIIGSADAAVETATTAHATKFLIFLILSPSNRKKSANRV